MYSIISAVHHVVRESISMPMYMAILSRIYTYIHVYIYIYKYIHTHAYTYILELLCPCPISPRPAALSPPSAVRSLRHVRRQLSPLSSQWSRAQRRCPRHQLYEVLHIADIFAIAHIFAPQNMISALVYLRIVAALLGQFFAAPHAQSFGACWT